MFGRRGAGVPVYLCVRLKTRNERRAVSSATPCAATHRASIKTPPADALNSRGKSRGDVSTAAPSSPLEKECETGRRLSKEPIGGRPSLFIPMPPKIKHGANAPVVRRGAASVNPSKRRRARFRPKLRRRLRHAG